MHYHTQLMCCRLLPTRAGTQGIGHAGQALSSQLPMGSVCLCAAQLLKLFIQSKHHHSYLQSHNGLVFIFITVTAKNPILFLFETGSIYYISLVYVLVDRDPPSSIVPGFPP